MIWCTTLVCASRWRTSCRWRRRGLVATNVIASGVHDASASNIIWGRMAAPTRGHGRGGHEQARRLARPPIDAIKKSDQLGLPICCARQHVVSSGFCSALLVWRCLVFFLREYHRSGAARAAPLGAGRARIKRQVLLRRRASRRTPKKD